MECMRPLLLLVSGIWLMAAPVAALAQYTYTTNPDGVTCTITSYTGSSGTLTIPSTIDGLTVVAIGDSAFAGTAVIYGNLAINYPDSVLTSVVIPDTVTNIGQAAFDDCNNLTNIVVWGNLGSYAFGDCVSLATVTILGNATAINEFAFAECHNLIRISIPRGVTSIGPDAFSDCYALTCVTIPESVASIADGTFGGCTSLAGIAIPNSVTNIGQNAFIQCASLTNVIIPPSITSIGSRSFLGCSLLAGVYFAGNAPATNTAVFANSPTTVFYLPGTTGWSSTFDGVPTSSWLLPYPVMLGQSSGLSTGASGFGFTISWATNLPVVIQACTNLVRPVWSPVATNTLTAGFSPFTDPQWTNYPGRFYRLRSP